jgi:anti-sigma B factor antagonist
VTPDKQDDSAPDEPEHTASPGPGAEAAASDPQIEDVLAISAEHPVPGIAVLTLRGELDMLTTPAFSSEVDAQLGRHLRALTIDLRQVTFLASTGLSALVKAHQDAESHGIALRLVGTDPAVARPIAAVGLGEVLKLHEDLETLT